MTLLLEPKRKDRKDNTQSHGRQDRKTGWGPEGGKRDLEQEYAARNLNRVQKVSKLGVKGRLI